MSLKKIGGEAGKLVRPAFAQAKNRIRFRPSRCFQSYSKVVCSSKQARAFLGQDRLSASVVYNLADCVPRLVSAGRGSLAAREPGSRSLQAFAQAKTLSYLRRRLCPFQLVGACPRGFAAGSRAS